MIKEDDISNIKNLDIGILDTLNVIKESENNFQNVPENKETRSVAAALQLFAQLPLG